MQYISLIYNHKKEDGLSFALHNESVLKIDDDFSEISLRRADDDGERVTGGQFQVDHR